MYLSGRTNEQVFFYWYGPKGGNGKSLLQNALTKVFGDFFAKLLGTVLVKDGNTHTADMAKIIGARLIMASELDASKPVDCSLIREWTGDEDSSSFRVLYEMCKDLK